MNPRKLVDSFKYALEGIIYCFRTQRNMRIHLSAAAIAVAASLVLRITRLELIIVLMTISIVITCELINTAIEKAVDTATEEYHPAAKVAKDVAAGAVLISAINAAAVGCIVFGPRLLSIIFRL